MNALMELAALAEDWQARAKAARELAAMGSGAHTGGYNAGVTVSYERAAEELTQYLPAIPNEPSKSPADRAVVALREAADALEALPEALSRPPEHPMTAYRLRGEANHIASVVAAAIEAVREPGQ